MNGVTGVDRLDLSKIGIDYTGGAEESIIGATPIEDVMTLKKALAADYGTDVATFTGGQALRFQSLEGLLHTITFREEHLVLWRDIEKDTAFSTVEEYSRLIEYGEYGDSFVGESEAPEETSAVLDRQIALVKFLGTIRSVTIAMQLVRAIVPDKIGFETYNGTLKLLRDWTRALYFGDSKQSRGGIEGKEFDGLYKIVKSGAPENIVDARGGSLTDTMLADVSKRIGDAYGEVNRVYLNLKTAQKFYESYYGTQRLFLPSPVGISTGFVINEFRTVAGTLVVRPDRLLRPPFVYRNAPTSPKAPNTTYTVSASIPGGGTGADWAKGDIVGGSVKYYVCAGNSKGLSAPVETSAISITNAAAPVKVDISETALGSIPAEFYVIFREDIKDGKTSGIGYIDRIPAGSAVTFFDNNQILPNSQIGFVGDFTRRCLVFARLLDLVKVDLPPVGQTIPWMLLLYGVPKYYNPKWLGLIVNIDYSRS